MKELARCPRKDCREALTLNVDTIGRVIGHCASCARNRQGICRHCPARLKPHPRGGYARTKFCLKCKAKVVQARERARKDQKAEQNAAWRARPGVQARLNRKAKEWRRLNPPTAIDRALQRANRQRLLSDATKREEYRAMGRAVYHRSKQNPEWLARRTAQRRKADRLRYLAKKQQLVLVAA